MTIIEALIRGYGVLKTAGAENYHLDAQLILAKALLSGADRLFVLTNPDFVLSKEQEARFLSLMEKRAAKCPIWYLTGECEFYGRVFKVTPDTLIPREDTEILVSAALKAIRSGAENVLEIGTGTGCIAITLKKEVSGGKLSVTAVDISEAALAAARVNAARLEAEIEFVCGDIYSALTPGRVYDLIVSNPPYIRTGDIAYLDSQVKDYEPIIALDGGGDGLFFYKAISEGAGAYLKKGGALLFEIGCSMADEVKEILTHSGFADITILKDCSGKDRVTEARLYV